MTIFDDPEVSFQTLYDTDTGDVVAYLFRDAKGRQAVVTAAEIEDFYAAVDEDYSSAVLLLRQVVQQRLAGTTH